MHTNTHANTETQAHTKTKREITYGAFFIF